MSLLSIIGGTFRALVIAAAAGAAAFGLLVVFEPFGRTSPAPVPIVTGSPAADALQARIAALRLTLRDSETELSTAQSASGPVSADASIRAEYEAQIAAATERRDLARRQAQAIRTSLDQGSTPASLAQILDSVVIGQMLAQQSALEAQIAIEGTRFRANHPTMRALTAQRTALAAQIRSEAANIATALDAEADIDDAQIALLKGKLPALAVTQPAPDTSALETLVTAQRAELDGLVDAYFNVPQAVTTAPAPARAEPFSLTNLAVIGAAAFAALLFQIVLAARRRVPPDHAADITAWAEDVDPESGFPDHAEPLRKAS